MRRRRLALVRVLCLVGMGAAYWWWQGWRERSQDVPIRAAAATFELLILDLGPLGAGAEIAFPQGEGCPFDAAIVLRDLRFATAAESEAIGHSLHDAGVEAVGIAENFVIEDEIPATSV